MSMVPEYATARSAHAFSFPLGKFGSAAAASLICLLLGLGLFRYPEHASGSFFPIETYCAAITAFIALLVCTIFFVNLLRAGFDWKILAAFALLGILPLPLYTIVYIWADSVKHFNFGPG
jgi:hypothetical protein